jgi:hypothetical protein
MLIHNSEPSTPTQIEMRYDPPKRKTGLAISVASLLLLIGGQWKIFRKAA